jgi:hypothetical protein
MNDLDWKRPALFGGLTAGILSMVPVVNYANCCFCAWALVGGAIAAKMLINRTPRPVKSGEGAKIGLMAGLVAAGTTLFLGMMITMIEFSQDSQTQMMAEIANRSDDPRVQEMMSRIVEFFTNMTTVQKFFFFLVLHTISSGLLGAFCVLGGLLGVALFENRKELPPSPPHYPPPITPTYPSQYPPQAGGE